MVSFPDRGCPWDTINYFVKRVPGRKHTYVKVDLNKNEEHIRSSTMSLLVTVDKSENCNLSFNCTAEPTGIYINSLTMSVKKRDRSQNDYKGPKYP